LKEEKISHWLALHVNWVYGGARARILLTHKRIKRGKNRRAYTQTYIYYHSLKLSASFFELVGKRDGGLGLPHLAMLLITGPVKPEVENIGITNRVPPTLPR
jgi:hypothetical protein